MTTIQNDPAKGLNAAVADTLNGERAAAGLTYDQLAELTGISKRTLIRLLSKKERHIDVAALVTLSSAFDLTAQEVVEAASTRMERKPLKQNLDTVRKSMTSGRSDTRKGA